jgi:hypothetical protein
LVALKVRNEALLTMAMRVFLTRDNRAAANDDAYSRAGNRIFPDGVPRRRKLGKRPRAA